jgi:hypothetical protein
MHQAMNQSTVHQRCGDDARPFRLKDRTGPASLVLLHG